jgi:hypothetical protein
MPRYGESVRRGGRIDRCELTVFQTEFGRCNRPLGEQAVRVGGLSDLIAVSGHDYRSRKRSLEDQPKARMLLIGVRCVRRVLQAEGPEICLAQPNGLGYGINLMFSGPTVRPFASVIPIRIVH